MSRWQVPAETHLGDKAVLVPDRRFALDHGFANAVELFPRASGEVVKWHLPFEKNPAYTREIVRAKDRLAALYSERVYARKLPYRQDAMESFYHCLGYAITFLLGDRLFRLNALAGTLSPDEVAIAEAGYIHDPRTSANDFYFRKMEANPFFNQWVVCALLPGYERVPVPVTQADIAGTDTVYSSKLSRLRENLAEKWSDPRALAGDSWRYLRSKVADGALQERLGFAISRHGRDIPCEYGAKQIQNLRKKSNSFFWPSGRLCALETSLLQGDERNFSDTFSRREFADLGAEVAEIFRGMLTGAGEQVHLPDESLHAIAPLLSQLLPTVVVEEVEVHASRFIEEMSRYRGGYYFCGATYSGFDSAFRTFAARQLGKKILSTQHSGWGGYLADGALVSELLIAGCDEYVTFGWTNEDPNVSSWLHKPVVLPSPFLSELRRRSGERGRERAPDATPALRRILLSTGFLYRFPGVYNSFLRVDTAGRWTKIIGEVVRNLAAANISVTVMMYSEENAILHRESLDGWLAMDPARITEYPDHDDRVRQMLQEPGFPDRFDAVVWDMPAGGFSEAVHCGVPTFSLWNEDLIRGLDFAQPFIADLLETGIFFPNGERLARTMESFYSVPNWYRSVAVQRPLAAFNDNFLLTDLNWEKPWAKFIDSL